MFPPEQDHRRGLGLFFFQRAAITDSSQPVLRAIHQAFPTETVVYGLPGSPATQHVTFLELIGPFDGDILPLIPQFHQVIEPVLAHVRPIHATFEGLAVNPTTIIMKGYPDDQHYNEVREILREKIRQAGLPELKRRKVQIFHSTIARFIRPIQDIEKLISLVDGFSEYRFGADIYSTPYLSTASWLMAESQIQKLHKYELENQPT